MSLVTNWGYTLTDADTLTGMLSPEEFDYFTADKYSGDMRTYSNISAASSAIREYCGWHVYPSAPCELSTTFFDGRVTTRRGTVLIQLPAKYVTSVSLVKIGETEYTSFVFETNGLLKIYDVALAGLREFTPVVIDYTAGLPDALMDGIKELVAHRVTHALASSGGIQSETAGGVSITYSANWTNSARATALADDNKEVLAPYRIQGVF